MQKIEQQIWDMIQPGVEDMGFRLVRVRLTGAAGKSDYTLQVMIEPPAAAPDNDLSVTVDECADVSRMISALMDVADPIRSIVDWHGTPAGDPGRFRSVCWLYR